MWCQSFCAWGLPPARVTVCVFGFVCTRLEMHLNSSLVTKVLIKKLMSCQSKVTFSIRSGSFIEIKTSLRASNNQKCDYKESLNSSHTSLLNIVNAVLSECASLAYKLQLKEAKKMSSDKVSSCHPVLLSVSLWSSLVKNWEQILHWACHIRFCTQESPKSWISVW